jgi:aconitate hydratase
MGVLPLVFKDGTTRKTLRLTGDEVIDVRLPAGVTAVRPGQDMEIVIARADGSRETVPVTSRLNTDNEIEYFKSGGILQYVLNNLVASAG